MSRFDIHLANVVAWCEQYEGELHHACITDPPYHMTDVHTGGAAIPGKFGERTAQQKQERSETRKRGGFMGKAWDGGDVAFRPETWAAIARVLHPGAFIMAFASARGSHRMAVAMEDAGLIIHPSIFGWCYGSGFPKATRIDTQVDRKAGAQRQVVGRRKHAPKFDVKAHNAGANTGYNRRDRVDFEETAPATDLAAAWQGHRYGLQALKPALEPIIVAQKPYEDRPVDCIVETGAGALWVDGGRIEANDTQLAEKYHSVRNAPPRNNAVFGRDSRPRSDGPIDPHPAGRWPANFYLSHHPDCADTCHPDCPVERIGRQSGVGKSGMMRAGTQRSTGGGYHGHMPPIISHDTYGDSGTAARYFFNADYALNALEDADPALYAAKASKAEREAGLLPAQRARMAELYGDDEADEFEATTVDDWRMNSGGNTHQRGETERYNTHPTIKPLAVARWLATLLLPPDLHAPRRLFVPFSGAGSEMIGALLAGWEYVQGVELMEDHVAIAHARAEWWINRPEMEREALRTAMTRPISGKRTAELTPLERMIADLEP